jgi:ubiquitin-protein ligase
MPDLSVTIVLPSGGARTAEVPDDVMVKDLLAELVALLELPVIGPDGRPMGYRLDSKALGRELQEDETLAEAHVPEEDRLILTADITAGGVSVEQSPRMRRMRADYEHMRELEGRTSLISFEAHSVRPNLPPERYIVTYRCKSIIGVNKRNEPKFGEHHQVEIYLHSQYPQRWPGLKWLTPIWHPNINHINGSVCIDAAWWTAARSLDRLVLMLGEMLQYKNFHDDPTQPPFPWDPEAARWCRDYRAKHPEAFPVDKRELMRPERVKIHAEDDSGKPSKSAKSKTSKGRVKTSGRKSKKPKIKKPRVKLK